MRRAVRAGVALLLTAVAIVAGVGAAHAGTAPVRIAVAAAGDMCLAVSDGAVATASCVGGANLLWSIGARQADGTQRITDGFGRCLQAEKLWTGARVVTAACGQDPGGENFTLVRYSSIFLLTLHDFDSCAGFNTDRAVNPLFVDSDCSIYDYGLSERAA